MNPTVRQKALDAAKKPLTKRIAIGFGILILLFGLFGYFFLPGIIKSKIEQQLTEKLKRPTTIERVEINPYALAVNIHQFRALEPDGKKTFASFKKLYVNVSMQSLFRLAPIVSELKLDEPYVHLARTGANQYSIDDILKLVAEQPTSDEPSRFAIYNIQVEGGKIEFEDQPKNKTHTVSNFKLGIPFVSLLPSHDDIFVKPFLNADINGSNLQLKGKTLPFSKSKETVVNLDFDNINLTNYVAYLPFKPQFKVNQAMLALHLTANFKQEPDQAPALVLKGQTTLTKVNVTALDGEPIFKLPELSIQLDGLNALSEQYNIARIALLEPEVNAVKSQSGALNLALLTPPSKAGKPAKSNIRLKIALNEFSIKKAKLKFQDQQATQPVSGTVEKFNLLIKNTKIDLKNQDINLAEVSSDSATLHIQHKKTKKRSSKKVEKARLNTMAEPGWGISIGKMVVADWSAQFEDRNLRRRRTTKVTPISFTANDLTTKQGKKGQIRLNAKVDQHGTVSANGSLGLASLHADLKLDLKNVSILPAQPYFTDQLNFQFTRANLSTSGSLQLDEDRRGALKGGFKGNVSLSQVATADKISAKDFVSWRNLSFHGINTKFEPFSLYISRVLLDRYYARIIISPEGRINLQDVIRGPGEKGKSLTESDDGQQKGSKTEVTATATAGKHPAEPRKAATKMPPIKINRLTLRRGRVQFTDNFIKPNYTANMLDLGGTVTDLSSKADTSAIVDLAGKVNSAPLTITGSLNPLKGDLFLDMKGNVKGMELAPLSAYSGKYAGYGIEKGQLSFDVAYKVDQRKLSAENHLILDQLTFGKKVDSPDATKLPVTLAVALLRDRNGVIDLRLPISGSLDDPKFSVGGIIIKAFFNLIAKAITSPFALLGSVFGGGEDLSWLNFEPGTTAISPNAEPKLLALSNALIDRPGLKLEITGLADPATDRAGLAEESIKRKVRLLKKQDMISDGTPIPPEGIVVTEKEYPDLLERVYEDEDFERPRNFIGFLKDLPVPEMENLMLKNAKITDDDLLQLGTERAQAVKVWLVAKKVPADRIYIVASKLSAEKDKQEPNRVDFSLK